MRLAVYRGLPKPLVAVGKNQCHLLSFAANYPGWHYYNLKCRATRRAIKGLVERGAIELNEFDQFRIVSSQS